MKTVDVVISGGGVVGCLAALAIAKHTQFSVLIVEASNDNTDTKTPTKTHGGFDARVIALAAESISTLRRLGVNIDDILHYPISSIHVSDRGHIGQVLLDAKDLAVDALGKVVAIKALGEHLLRLIEAMPQVSIVRPASIHSIDRQQDGHVIKLATNEPLSFRCKLLLVSDGGQSNTRQLLNTHADTYDYEQTAIITNVKTQNPHSGIAYERFTTQGPIAFLPMANAQDTNSDRYMSVVWCLQRQRAAAKLALGDAEFLAQLQLLFGHKLGRLESCSERLSYPLKLSQTNDFAQHRTLFIGNAAQNLHPIAGQGFNLGIRDVMQLVDALKSVDDPGAFACTQAYKKMRISDKQATIKATTALVSVFSNQFLPMVIGRNIGLLGLNTLAGPKARFARFAMGVRDVSK